MVECDTRDNCCYTLSVALIHFGCGCKLTLQIIVIGFDVSVGSLPKPSQRAGVGPQFSELFRCCNGRVSGTTENHDGLVAGMLADDFR